MRRLRKLVSALISSALVVLTGCVALHSLEGDHDGVIYHLPKTLLTVTVRQYHDPDASRIWYTLGGPGGGASKGADGKDLPPREIREIFSETIADPEHRYVINYRPSKLSDDRLCISRAPNGLLHDVQFAADDRTPEIIFNLARFIAGFIGQPSAAAYSQTELKSGATIEVREYTSKIDPFDPDDIEVFRTALRRIFRANLKVDFTRMHKMVEASAATWPTGCSIKDRCPPVLWTKRCGPDHICYRTKLSLPVELTLDGRPVDVKYADIINTWDIGAISVTRAALVQKITKLRFEDGALAAAIIRKPSEVEEATLIPLNVMNAVLSVPSGLWQSAFNDQKHKETVIAEMTKNSQQIEALNARQKNLFLQGEAAIGPGDKERYQLNCSVTARTAGVALGNFQNSFGGND